MIRKHNSLGKIRAGKGGVGPQGEGVGLLESDLSQIFTNFNKPLLSPDPFICPYCSEECNDILGFCEFCPCDGENVLRGR